MMYFRRPGVDRALQGGRRRRGRPKEGETEHVRDRRKVKSRLADRRQEGQRETGTVCGKKGRCCLQADSCFALQQRGHSDSHSQRQTINFILLY